MDQEEAASKLLQVHVHYNGKFSPNPLVYLDPTIVPITDVDFGSLDLTEFHELLRRLCNGTFEQIYFCSPSSTLAEGITILTGFADYTEFCVTGYNTTDCRVDLYIDHKGDPVLDWAEMDAPEEDEDYIHDSGEDDDNESEKSYEQPYEHELDDEVPILNQTKSDAFLSKMSAIPSDHVNKTDDDETEPVKPVVFPVHDENQEWYKMKPVLGMKFSNPLELKHCLSNYAVKGGYDLWYERNDSKKILVKCGKGKKKGEGCPFRLWASWMGKEHSFQIKSLIEQHNCARVFKFGSIVTYKWIGKHFMNEILQNPKLSIRKLKAKVSEKFNLIASVCQCRHARKYAFQEIEGNLEEHYGKVWSYAEELRRTNPGSTVQVDVDPMPDGTTYFSKFYVCLKGLKDGWTEGCRRVIGLDGCFLKGVCRGQLLAATGRDANNHIYPIAWAVVPVESKEVWKWFVDLLIDDLGLGDGHGLILISDQHKVSYTF